MAADWRPSAEPAVLQLRARMLAATRGFFEARGVLEVETPLVGRHGVTDPHLASFRAGGDDEEVPGRYLQTSPEFAMKRLLAAGHGDIYQIAKAFRWGERGSRHNPEFTLVEWYRRGFDHRRLAAEVAALLALLLDTDLSWQRRPYRQVMMDHGGIDPVAATDAALAAHATALGLDAGSAATMDRDGLLDFVFASAVQPRLGAAGLDVVDDYPPSQAALARVSGSGDAAVAHRFEVFLDGVELANGYHELADAAEQRRRMEADRRLRRECGLPDCSPDERLLAALDNGLPDCAGVALGFDRVVMLRTGASDIGAVLAFPYELA